MHSTRHTMHFMTCHHCFPPTLFGRLGQPAIMDFSRQRVGGRAKQQAPAVARCPALSCKRAVGAVAARMGHKAVRPVLQTKLPAHMEPRGRQSMEEWSITRGTAAVPLFLQQQAVWRTAVIAAFVPAAAEAVRGLGTAPTTTIQFEVCAAARGKGAAPSAAVPGAALSTAAVTAAPVYGASSARTQVAGGHRRKWHSACPSRTAAAPWSPVAVHAASDDAFEKPAISGNSDADKIVELERDIQEVMNMILKAFDSNRSDVVMLALQDVLHSKKDRLERLRSAQAPPPVVVRPVERRQLHPHPTDPNVWLLRDVVTKQVVEGKFVINPLLTSGNGRVKGRLEMYATQVQRKFEKKEPQYPLVISGPIKSGKSHAMETFLPAVVHTCIDFDWGSGSDPGCTRSSRAQKPTPPIFLRVNCMSCPRAKGVTGFLTGLLVLLKEAAKQQGLAAAAAAPLPTGDHPQAAEVALRTFLDALPCDRVTYLLLDEAHTFCMLESGLGSQHQPPSALGTQPLDLAEIKAMRLLFKILVTEEAPYHVAPVITGSSMASVWANFAPTPTNGAPILSHNFPLHLPADVDADVMCSTWRCLSELYPQLPAKLRELCWPNHALLVWLVDLWQFDGQPEVTDTYVMQQFSSKLFSEIYTELKAMTDTLNAADPDQAKSHLVNLLDQSIGCDPKVLGHGIYRFLESELQPAAIPNHMWLPSALYHWMMQMVLQSDGTLMPAPFWSESTVGDVMDMTKVQTLGQECVRILPNPSSLQWDCNKPILDLLQKLAAQFPNQTPEQLYNSPWLQDALNQDACRYIRNSEQRTTHQLIKALWNAKELDTVCGVMLAYASCMHDCFAHYTWARKCSVWKECRPELKG